MCWSAAWIKSVDKYYAKASEYIGNGLPNITHYLHIEIMQSTEYVVDHIDTDRLNNREINLRVTKQLLNTKNRTSKNKNNTTGYRNVIMDKRSGKYKIMLCINNKRFRVGKLYTDIDEDGKDAEMYRKKYYGEFAGNT